MCFPDGRRIGCGREAIDIATCRIHPIVDKMNPVFSFHSKVPGMRTGNRFRRYLSRPQVMYVDVQLLTGLGEKRAGREETGCEKKSYFHKAIFFGMIKTN